MKVICPHKHLGELGEIVPYLKVIETTQAVYATEYKNYVGSGVFDECHFALTNGINVLAVRKDIKDKFFVQEVIETVKSNSYNYISLGCLITK